MCFNAAKSYVFGWYSNAHLDVEPTNTGNGLHAKMVSIDDYLNNNAGGANEYAVARLQGSSEEDLFFLYNRKKGVTSGVVEYGDEVVIVRQSQSYAQSYLISHLRDQTYTQSNWEGSGNDLVIKVCDRVSDGSLDYANVLVYVDGPNNIACDDIEDTPSPSLIPTAAPTMTPTAAPTMIPTAAPTMTPTAAPTMTPTVTPTSTPTLMRTAPTSAPSSAPSPTSAPQCTDSGFGISYQGNSISCALVVQNDACSISVAASHCPLTCDVCDEYACKNSMAPFARGFTCDQLLVNFDPDLIATKCAEIDDLATTCREICNFCNN